MHCCWSQDHYLEALRFAALAHLGQKVPGTEIPYVVHVTLVSMEVIAALRAEQGHDEDLAVLCALLHDVIEDTEVTYSQLESHFGTSVANGVLALSKDATLPKDTQMQDSLRRIRQQPGEVWMVKLADRISNLQPPPSYWTVDQMVRYREEARLIHRTLAEASTFLSARLMYKIEAYGAYMDDPRRKP